MLACLHSTIFPLYGVNIQMWWCLFPFIYQTLQTLLLQTAQKDSMQVGRML